MTKKLKNHIEVQDTENILTVTVKFETLKPVIKAIHEYNPKFDAEKELKEYDCVESFIEMVMEAIETVLSNELSKNNPMKIREEALYK